MSWWRRLPRWPLYVLPLLLVAGVTVTYVRLAADCSAATAQFPFIVCVQRSPLAVFFAADTTYNAAGSGGTTPTIDQVGQAGNSYDHATDADHALTVRRSPTSAGQRFYTDAGGVVHNECFVDGSTNCTWSETIYDNDPKIFSDQLGTELLRISHTGVLTFATGARMVLSSSGLTSAAADPADSGVIRLGNAETICWESSPAGTDNCLSVNSSEQLTFNGVQVGAGAGTIAGTIASSQLCYGSATDTCAGTNNLTWTNASTRLGVQGVSRVTNGTQSFDMEMSSTIAKFTLNGSNTKFEFINNAARDILYLNNQDNQIDFGNGTDNYTVRLLSATAFTAGTGTFTFNSPPVFATTLPVRSIFIPAGAMQVSGTCTDTDPVVRTPVASGPKLATIQPADDNTCSIEFDVDMPDAWNAGTVTVELEVLSTGNNNTEVLGIDFAGQCVRSADQIAAHSTTGEQESTCTFGNQTNDFRQCTSAAITLNGTCAAGAHVFFRGQVDATSTTVTPVSDIHILGVKVEYSVNTSTDN